MSWMLRSGLHKASGGTTLRMLSLVGTAGICFTLLSLAFFQPAVAQDVPLDSVADWSSDVLEDARSIAWGDVNGDGHLDLAVAGGTGIKIYMNHGGILEQIPAWTSQEAGTPLSLAWGDVNGDGLLDLAVGSDDHPTRVYFNHGGILEKTASWNCQGCGSAGSVAWGDVNSDGNLDLAVAGGWRGPASIYINHGGILEESANWHSSDPGSASSVAWGDVNGDGYLDLAVGNSSSYSFHQTRVYINHGGVLEHSASWTSQEEDNVRSVAWGDMNGDGFLDLAVGNHHAPTRVYINRDGFLEETASWNSKDTSFTDNVAWGDINGDGYLDLAIGNSGGEPTRAYINQGGILEQTPSWSSLEVGYYMASVACGDMDGDGLLDLAVGISRQPIRIHLNHGGILRHPSSWNSQEPNNASSVAWGDVNADGYPDLAVGNHFPNGQQTRVYLNHDGDLEQAASWSSRETNDALSVAWGDMNGDDCLDLAVGNMMQPTRVYINRDGLLEETSSWNSQEENRASCVAWGDVNGDGFMDLAVGNEQQPTRVYINDDGILEQTSSWNSQDDMEVTMSVAWGDMNGDGDLDLAVGTAGGFTMIYINHGGFLEQMASWNSQLTDASSVAWGDVNADGFLDLAVGNYGGQPINVYVNRGGVLEQTASWSSQGIDHVASVAWGDVNGDGYLDLAVGNDLMQPIRVYMNRYGILEQVASWNSPEAHMARSVAWGDVNADGYLDLAVGDYSMRPTRVYLNGEQRSCARAVVLPNTQTCLTMANIVPSDTVEGRVRIAVELVDDDSDLASLTAEYSELGGGRWQKATLIGDVSRFATSPEGVNHEVMWDTDADGADGNNVVLQLRASSNPDRAGLILWPAAVYQLPVGRIDGKPRIFLLYPSPNASVVDSLHLYGRIWDPTNFAEYEISLSQLPDTASWIELKRSYAPAPTASEISSLDMSGFSAGDYVLRVEATDAGQHKRVLDRSIKLARRTATAPRAVSWFPPEGATDVPRKSPIIVVFDRPMNQGALTTGVFEMSRATGVAEGNVLYDASSRALVFDPGGLLDSAAFHYFVVSGSFPAQSGDRLAGDVVSSFETGGGIPTDDIASIVPRRGTSGWRLQDSLSVTYARPSEFRYVTVFGLDGDTVLTDALVTGSNVTSRVALPHLRPKTVYLVRISDDPTFNGPDDFVSYFITGDADLPVVTGVSPAKVSWLVGLDAVITVNFSKGINTFSADSTSFYLLGPTGRLSGLITFGTSGGGTTATLSPSQPLDPGTTYTAILTSRIQDNIGNAIDSTSWTFTTGYFKTMPPAGGEFVAGDLSAYFVPGSFSRDTEVKAGRMPATTVNPPDSGVEFLGVAYDLLAESQPLKPVEVRLAVPAMNLTAADVPVLYRWDGSVWVYVGGTYDRQAGRLNAVVSELGRLGVFAMEQVPEQEELSALSGITLTPRAFSPAGSLLRREVAISFALAAPGRVTVKVYNLAGRLERVLVSDEWMASGTNAVTWSGQDYNGGVVPSGLYIVTVEAAGRTEKKTVAVVNQ